MHRHRPPSVLSIRTGTRLSLATNLVTAHSVGQRGDGLRRGQSQSESCGIQVHLRRVRIKGSFPGPAAFHKHPAAFLEVSQHSHGDQGAILHVPAEQQLRMQAGHRQQARGAAGDVPESWVRHPHRGSGGFGLWAFPDLLCPTAAAYCRPQDVADAIRCSHLWDTALSWQPGHPKSIFCSLKISHNFSS